MEQAWLKIGTYCMGFGTVLFLILLAKAKKSDRPHFTALIFIVATAMASYTAMALGQGNITLSDGHSIYLPRYIDWLITTPLLLLSMGYVAARSLKVTATALVAAIGADVYMIATGLAGGMTSGDGKWIWYTLSCLGFVGVLVLLWGPIRAHAKSVERARAFSVLSGLLTILWVQYPFVWLLGEEGIRNISSVQETMWFTVLDVLAKVAFGIASIVYMQRFPHEASDQKWINSDENLQNMKTESQRTSGGTSTSFSR